MNWTLSDTMWKFLPESILCFLLQLPVSWIFEHCKRGKVSFEQRWRIASVIDSFVWVLGVCGKKKRMKQVEGKGCIITNERVPKFVAFDDLLFRLCFLPKRRGWGLKSRHEILPFELEADSVITQTLLCKLCSITCVKGRGMSEQRGRMRQKIEERKFSCPCLFVTQVLAPLLSRLDYNEVLPFSPTLPLNLVIRSSL